MRVSGAPLTRADDVDRRERTVGERQRAGEMRERHQGDAGEQEPAPGAKCASWT